MTSIRSSLPLLLLLVVAPAGCGGGEPERASAPAAAPGAVAHPLVRALQDADPAVRRDAAEGLGALERATVEVIRALVDAQSDVDEGVAAAASTALDRIHPAPDVALRVFGDECYGTVAEQVCVCPEYMTWRKVDCEPDAAVGGAQRGACWRLVVVPAIYEATTFRVLMYPEAGRWQDARDVRADDAELIQPTAPPPPRPRAIERPPQGAPEGADQGEVWCWYERETPTGGEWHRHPECEVPGAPR